MRQRIKTVIFQAVALAIVAAWIAGQAVRAEGAVVGNFAEGQSEGWKMSAGMEAFPGEGLRTAAPLGVASHPLDAPSREAGTWHLKATVWPKGGSDNWIAFGFYPGTDTPQLCGLNVLLRGEPIGTSGGGGTLNGGNTEDTPQNSNILKSIAYSQIGPPPYSVELTYSPQLKSVTLGINGNVLFENTPISFNGVPGEAPPPDFFAFAGIVFFNQEGKEGEPGTVQNVTVEWNP